ncbi:MAG: hypothetical protein Q9201_006300 [Fulgogasparrea decipioides]
MNDTAQDGFGEGDVMDWTREDSPATVVGDSPPQSHQAAAHDVTDVDMLGEANSRRIPPTDDIIDLEGLEDGNGFGPDDFMTDEDFQAAFGPENYTRKGSGTANGTQLSSYSANGRTFKKGKTVELDDGDFLRIVSVFEDRETGNVSLQGYRLRRLSIYQQLFDSHLNELIMVLEEGDSMGEVPFSNVLRIRDVVMTNAAYPSYGCKEDPENSNVSRDVQREQCRLVCRWKMLTSYRPHTTKGRVWVEKSLVRLRAVEADVNFALDNEHIRRKYRGNTVKGGSNTRWLAGEREFDAAELTRNRGIDILDFSSNANIRSHVQGPRYVFGDAFCGAGGASRGAKAAGLRVDWGFDFDPAAIETYRRNFFGARCEATPVDIFISSIKDDFRVEVLHISPCCQPYSPAHTRAGRNDEANQATFFAVGELLRKVKPRLVVLENTSGLVERWPEWLHAMIRVFTSLGFNIRWRVFNLAQYGLPQARRRLILFASCPGEELPDYPPPTHGPGLAPFTTINSAIRRIPQGFANHKPEGAAKRDVRPYDGNLPLRNCITTGGTVDVHPSGRRRFTDRELASLQGFPLEHVFGNTKVKMQIGNAVPPLVAKVFFDHIRKFLEGVDGLL